MLENCMLRSVATRVQIIMFKQMFMFGVSRIPKCHADVAAFSSTCGSGSPKVAVILSGSGVYDGSEIHEVSAVAAHLTRAGIEPVFYAPDMQQLHVINHIKGCPVENEVRNVLLESARIARGNVKPLNELTATSADALVFPGGFGAAKNLCDFALYGTECKVIEDVSRVLNTYHKAKKPIALCCIAPVLAAKVFQGSNITITLGHQGEDGGKWPHAGAIAAAKKLGANVEEKCVGEICFDERNLLITTPAFMYDGKFHEIYDGIGLMINKLVTLIKK